MTQDEIIEMARQSGLVGKPTYTEGLVAFGNLVTQREREACAKVCDAGINNATDWDSSVWDQACENRALHGDIEHFAALVIDCLTLDELREAMIESQHMVLVRSGVRIVDLKTQIENLEGEDR